MDHLESQIALSINQYFKKSDPMIISSISREVQSLVRRFKDDHSFAHQDIAYNLADTYSSISSYTKIIIDILSELKPFSRLANILKAIDSSLERIFSFVKIQFSQRKDYQLQLIQKLQANEQVNGICTHCSQIILSCKVQETKLLLGVGQFKDPFNLFNLGEADLPPKKNQNDEYKKKYFQVWENKKKVEEKLQYLKLEADKRDYGLEYSKIQAKELEEAIHDCMKGRKALEKTIPLTASSGFEENMRRLVKKIHEQMANYRLRNLYSQGVQADLDSNDYISNLKAENDQLQITVSEQAKRLDHKEMQISELRIMKLKKQNQLAIAEETKLEKDKLIEYLKKQKDILGIRICEMQLQIQNLIHRQSKLNSDNLNLPQSFIKSRSPSRRVSKKKSTIISHSVQNALSDILQRSNAFQSVEPAVLPQTVKKTKKLINGNKRRLAGRETMQHDVTFIRKKVSEENQSNLNENPSLNLGTTDQVDSEIEQDLSDHSSVSLLSASASPEPQPPTESAISAPKVVRKTLKKATVLSNKMNTSDANLDAPLSFGGKATQSIVADVVLTSNPSNTWLPAQPLQSIQSTQKVEISENRQEKPNAIIETKQPLMQVKKVKKKSISINNSNSKPKKVSAGSELKFNQDSEEKGLHSGIQRKGMLRKTHNPNHGTYFRENHNKTIHISSRRDLFESKPIKLSLLKDEMNVNKAIEMIYKCKKQSLQIEFEEFKQFVESAIDRISQKKPYLNQESQKLNSLVSNHSEASSLKKSITLKNHILFKGGKQNLRQNSLIQSSFQSLSNQFRNKKATLEPVYSFQSSPVKVSKQAGMGVAEGALEQLFQTIYLSEQNAYIIEQGRKNKGQNKYRESFNRDENSMLNAFLLMLAKVHTVDQASYEHIKSMLLFPFSSKNHSAQGPVILKSQGVGHQLQDSLSQIIALHQPCPKSGRYCTHLKYLHDWISSLI